MAYTAFTTKWTPEKNTQLKNLILRHVSHGGSVLDACEQFEYETGGLHKKRMNYLRWSMFIRKTCKDEFYRARQMGLKMKIYKLEEPTDSVAEGLQAFNEDGDAITNRLIASVIDIVEDRRRIDHLYHEQTENLNQANNQIHSLEEDNKKLEYKFAEKEQELHVTKQQLLESEQHSLKLSESYELLKSVNAQEYQNLQDQYISLQDKFSELNQQMEELRASSAKQIQRLESQLWESLVKNKELVAEINRMNEEKTTLVKSITDFASHMTSMLPSEAATQVAPTANKTVMIADKHEAANQ